jgi:hypothetical protein
LGAQPDGLPSRTPFFAAGVSVLPGTPVRVAGSNQLGEQLWQVVQRQHGAWSSEGEGAVDSGLTSISALSDTDMWAVGYKSGLTLAVRGDGTSWREVATPNPPGDGYAQLNAVSMDRSHDAWAVGESGSDPISFPRYSLIEHWNGKTWQIVEGRNPGTQTTLLRGVAALAPNDVWAVGEADGGGLVEHWNGRKWSIASTDGPMLSAVSADSPTDVWVVGAWYESNQAPFAEHWDGSSWKTTPVSGPKADNYLIGVKALAPDDVWAVGAAQQADYGRTAPLTEHWDGSSWRVVDSPNPPDHDNLLLSVDADSATNVWATGVRGFGLRTVDGITMHWDGQRWREGEIFK